MTSELIAVYVENVEPDPRATLCLAILVDADRVRIEVGGRPPDVSPDELLHSRATPSLGGMGLQIVERMADAWGLGDEAGSMMWFELARPRARRGVPSRSAAARRGRSGTLELRGRAPRIALGRGAAFLLRGRRDELRTLEDVRLQPRLGLLAGALELAQARGARLARRVRARAVQVALVARERRELAQFVGAVVVVHRSTDVTPPRGRYRQGRWSSPPPARTSSCATAPAERRIVVLGFPYDPHIVNVVRAIPGRRFDWDAREWWAPVDDWVGVHVAEVLERFPDLTSSAEVDAWLAQIKRRWIGHVSTMRFDGRGWWVLATRAGTPPEELVAGFVEHEGRLLAPLTIEGAAALAAEDNARLDAGANRCVEALLGGDTDLPPARLTAARTFDGERLRLDVLWDPELGTAFGKLPGAEPRGRTMPVDPWVVPALDEFVGVHQIAVDGPGEFTLAALRREHDEAMEAIRLSRATSGDPIPECAEVLGGELAPFQWAGVRYALDARRTFIADEQGLGKTVEALAAIEADGAFPAVVVCPASLKLNWQREACKWLPHRDVVVIEGRSAVRADGRDHDPELRDRRRAP